MVAVAADPVPDVKETINRGLTFLAEDGLVWKGARRCASCHHVPFAIWALSEGKKQGYAVDEKALAELTAWSVAKDDPAKLFPKPPTPQATPPKEAKQPKEPTQPKQPSEPKQATPPTPAKLAHPVVNEALLLMALGIEARDDKRARDGLRKMLTGTLRDQCDDGSWKLSHQSRPIGSSPEVLTTLALLALSAPNAPDLGKEGKAAREKGLRWLRATDSDDEPQAAALRLILWRRLGLSATEWEPLVKKLRSAQNSDGGWGQTKKAKSDAYATGQALYALAEAGAKPNDEAVRKARSFLAKAQGQDGAWAMVSRAILPSGKPPKDMEPITFASSAWAVLGLVRSAPDVAKSGSAAAK
jgi:hypothetical protein